MFVPSAASKIAHVTGTSTTDSTVSPGTYYYQVVASDGNGNAGSPVVSNQVTVVAPDTQAPSVPGNVATSVTGSNVAVSWDASTDDTAVTGYDLYRGSTAGFTPDASTKVATVTGTAKTDAGVLGGTWYYKVVAFDGAGNRSAASDPATAVVVPPAPVTTTVTTSADTYVNAGAKTTNYGTSASAIVDGSPVQQMLLRFALPATPSGQQLTSAVLRVRTTTQAISSAANELDVRLADDGWDEATVTYNTKPAVGTANLGSLASVDVNTSYDIPLDAAALRSLTGGDASLAIVTAGDDNAQFLTRETGAAASRPAADPHLLVRIAQVINLVDERGSYGGPLRVALNQVDELRRRGHDVTCSQAAAGGLATSGRRRSPAPSSRSSRRTARCPGAGSPGRSRRVSPRTWRGELWAPPARYDVVHVHLGRDLTTLPAAAAALATGTPYVVQTHGMIDASSRALARPSGCAADPAGAGRSRRGAPAHRPRPGRRRTRPARAGVAAAPAAEWCCRPA